MEDVGLQQDLQASGGAKIGDGGTPDSGALNSLSDLAAHWL